MSNFWKCSGDTNVPLVLCWALEFLAKQIRRKVETLCQIFIDCVLSTTEFLKKHVLYVQPTLNPASQDTQAQNA